MQELKHFTVPRFWRAYDELPREIRDRADKQFQLLKENPRHPSVQFKKIWVKDGVELWSARVTQGYRRWLFGGRMIFPGSGLETIRTTTDSLASLMLSLVEPVI